MRDRAAGGTALLTLEIGIARQRSVIGRIVGKQQGQRRIVQRQPFAVVRDHRGTRHQQSHPSIVGRGFGAQIADLDKARDQRFDSARAAQPIGPKRAFEIRQCRPRCALAGLVPGVEADDQIEQDDTRGLAHHLAQKGLIAVKL
ncbi:hypothetical protein ACFO8O_01530 [Hephaestia sp. GCM10023244]|uniref:hypothetical protein n=1 Tax=unclassified Hephaestia TaxID=2631281 RepID=UPI002077101E|nr:hypothetical protein [Hephaestia sp. MAHUQ-44]MCM8729652.1 hypothetical protein [Hephaestia sp. MAHUQ-44]